MDVVGMSEELKTNVLEIITIILYLGNIRFNEENNVAEVEDPAGRGDSQPARGKDRDSQVERQTDRQRERHTDIQLEGQTDRQTDRQREIQIDKQAGRGKYRQTNRQAGSQRERKIDRLLIEYCFVF